MRTRQALTTATAITAAVLTLAACGGGGDDGSDAEKTLTYDVISEELPDGAIGQVVLLMPDATVEEAQTAIHDYAESIDGPKAVTISVVREADAASIVCRATWPDVDIMNCPRSTGS